MANSGHDSGLARRHPPPGDSTPAPNGHAVDAATVANALLVAEDPGRHLRVALRASTPRARMTASATTSHALAATVTAAEAQRTAI